MTIITSAARKIDSSTTSHGAIYDPSQFPGIDQSILTHMLQASNIIISDLVPKKKLSEIETKIRVTEMMLRSRYMKSAPTEFSFDLGAIELRLYQERQMLVMTLQLLQERQMLEMKL